ncbi:MAG: hypothetical protein JXR03_09500 [Cyclobacteriaceae bacterium]
MSQKSIPIQVILFTFSLNCSLLAQEQKVVSDTWIIKNENKDYIARHECSFVQAGEKFIMFGGRESAQTLNMYDYKTNTWSVGASAPKEFNHFQATAYKGFVWVIGSFKTNNFPKEIPADNIWLYHIPSDRWIKGPEIPENRRRGGAGLVEYKDNFYVIAGNTRGHDGGYVKWFDQYDPFKNTWIKLEDASEARDHFHAAVIGDKLYAAGGRRSGGEGGVFGPLPKPVDVYDFNTKEWSVLKEGIPTPRAAPGTAVFNGELLLMGGEGESPGPAYQLVEAYNPQTDVWSQKADMNFPRHGTQTIVSGNGVYITGGSPVRGGGSQRNMEVYNEDAPAGIALIASTLSTAKKCKIKAGKAEKIVLKCEGGNTASFISEIKLEGENTDNFEVGTDLNFRLINTGNEVFFKVKHVGNKKNDQAKLTIIYNGGSTESVVLTSK